MSTLRLDRRLHAGMIRLSGLDHQAHYARVKELADARLRIDLDEKAFKSAKDLAARRGWIIYCGSDGWRAGGWRKVQSMLEDAGERTHRYNLARKSLVAAAVRILEELPEVEWQKEIAEIRVLMKMLTQIDPTQFEMKNWPPNDIERVVAAAEQD